MAEGFDHDIDSTRKRESAEHATPAGPEQAVVPALAPEAAYPGTLFDGNALNGRGNAPVRTAMLQRMQQTYGNRAVQRFLRVQRSASQAPAAGNISDQIEARAGQGNPLDRTTQTRLESGLGADLSGVRVHTDGEADRLARSVDSVAFTTGSDIFFRSGAYDPGSDRGMHLLAHEATHTVQQSQGPVSGTPHPGGVSISDPSDQFEQAAEQSAHNVLSRKPVDAQTMRATATPSVQRAAIPEEEEEEGKAVQSMRSLNAGIPVQREGLPEEEEQTAPVQAMRASAHGVLQREAAPEEEEEEGKAIQSMREHGLAVQREGVPEEEEEEQTTAAQAMRVSTYAIAIQRQADPSYAGSHLGGMQNRGAVVIQRSMAGSFPVTQGIWEMGMVTQEGAVKGTGPSGLQGTIKFAPGKDSPYSNHIALIQIVKLTDAGGANVNPASLPSGSAPHLRTTEDKAKGVEGGFFTDVLHNDFTGTGKDAPKGSNLSPNYPFGPSGGSQTLGFKRSEEPADIKAAELFDFPGTTSNTSNLDFSFETVAKGTDSLNIYGSVKWAFGLRAGRVVGESGPHVNDVASATFNAALEKHRDFYVHEPVVFHFLFDSDEMEPGDEAKADTFLDYLRKFPDVRLNLHGFADQRGSVDYNRKLALRRANKTAQVLIAKGVAADRINPLVPEGKTTGFTDDATTNQDREANRRGNRTVVCIFEHTATPGSPP